MKGEIKEILVRMIGIGGVLILMLAVQTIKVMKTALATNLQMMGIHCTKWKRRGKSVVSTRNGTTLPVTQENSSILHTGLMCDVANMNPNVNVNNTSDSTRVDGAGSISTSQNNSRSSNMQGGGSSMGSLLLKSCPRHPALCMALLHHCIFGMLCV
eukprot:1528986-Ditylum_brightwellii.AAC.1